MTAPLTPRMRELLSERIERLHKLDQLNAPPAILSSAVLLVFKGAAACYPTQFGAEFAGWVGEAAKAEAAICAECGGYLPHEMHRCTACILKGGEDD